MLAARDRDGRMDRLLHDGRIVYGQMNIKSMDEGWQDRQIDDRMDG